MAAASDTDWRNAASVDYTGARRVLVEQRARYRREIEDLQKSIARIEGRVAEVDAEIADFDTAARVFGLKLIEGGLEGRSAFALEAPTVESGEAPSSASSPQFKDKALEVLEGRYPQSVKSAELQEIVERALGRKFHEKTAGMTLYRFSQDRVVRREGRDWYFVPPEARHDLVAPTFAVSEDTASDHPSVQEDAAMTE